MKNEKKGEQMKCPDCGGELKTDQKFGQGVWRCTKCGWSWFILKLRKKGEIQPWKKH